MQDQSVSGLVGEFRQGDKRATVRLTELLYPELKRLAIARMAREKGDHTWQATALVNELYLELLKVRELKKPEGDPVGEKAAFLGFASHVMNRLLVGHARRLYRRVVKTEVDEAILSRNEAVDGLQRLESALQKLEQTNPRLRTVVEMRVFEGLSGDEIAERLGCSLRTVLRDWAFAKELLTEELGPAAGIASK